MSEYRKCCICGCLYMGQYGNVCPECHDSIARAESRDKDSDGKSVDEKITTRLEP